MAFNNGEIVEQVSIKSPPIDVSSSRKTLIEESQKRFSIFGNRRNFLKFGSPSMKLRQLADDRDRVARSVESSNVLDRILLKKIDWESLSKMGKEWFKQPMNLALFAWIVAVAVSGAILFLVLTGMLNRAIPSKDRRNAWFEVNNQILNALFTLMCLYQHPKRFYHLFLLIRYNLDDVAQLRRIYCKNGTYKPHEWIHMMVVVVLLHVNCFAQYALCGLNVGFKRSQRPPVGVALCVSVAISAPAVAGLYCIASPLGKEYETEVDEELQNCRLTPDDVRRKRLRLKSLERRYSFSVRTPEWSGGVLDIWDDISLAYLSVFCSCCVFGWNMERLGFGNMYVHIATFLLFCMAPFWIFNLAAVNIENEQVREFLGITGVVLCCLGLLYGGFWRMQMRKRFNLPQSTFCFGHSSSSDCVLWLCCCWCALAQEVRTANSYDVVDDRLLRKCAGNSFDQVPFSPLSMESPVPSSPYVKKSPNGSPFRENLDSIQEMLSSETMNMDPPSPVKIKIDRD